MLVTAVGSVAAGTGNSIRGNSIHTNSKLGIDLAADSVTVNDAGDGDPGPNNLQNFPVLTSTVTNGVDTITIDGTLNSTASTTFYIDFYASTDADSSGYGEGQTYLGSDTISTDPSGDATISTVLDVFVAANDMITATVTSAADGTSEFSEAIAATPANTPPTIASALPDTTVTEDNGPINGFRDLNAVFNDIEDGDALDFAIQSNDNPGLATAAINQVDSTLGFTFTPDLSGSATIVIRATDSGALFVDDTLVVAVNPQNDPPVVVAAIPDAVVAENSPAMNDYRDLNDVFSDVEDAQALAFSIESNSNPGLVAAIIDPADSTLDFSITPSMSGNATIIIRATDSGLLFIEDTFLVTVVPDTSSIVTLVDSTGTLIPSDAFPADPALEIRIGINNLSALGVMLDTTSVVRFTDGTDTYRAKLANMTYIPPNARNFTTGFLPASVPATITVPATYGLELLLQGVDDDSDTYIETISTAGRNEIFIDTPKVKLVSLPLQVAAMQPGQTSGAVLAIDFENGYATERLLDSLTVTNSSVGPGTPAQLDGEIAGLRVFDDVDSSLTLTAPDTLVALSIFNSGRAAFAFADGWRVPALGHRAIIITADLDSFAARDGDRLDLSLTSPVDIVFQGSTAVNQDFSPLYPLNSFGFLVVDGMVRHQLALVASAVDTLNAGSNENLVLTVDIPQNGYEPDTLKALSIVNNAADFSLSDIDGLYAYFDDGDGVFNAGLDANLGELVFSGDRFALSGLSEAIDPNARLFITANVSATAANGDHFQPGVPLGGIEVASANDGPIDVKAVVAKSYIFVNVESISVTNLPLAPAVVTPGETSATLLLMRIANGTLQTLQLDTLNLVNTTSGGGAISDFDNTFSNVQLYQDDGNGVIDGWDTVLASGLSFSGGAMAIANATLDVQPGQSKHILLAAVIDSTCARDGDTLRVEVPTMDDVVFDQPFPLIGAFPMATKATRVVNGMMSFQLAVYPRTDSLVVTGGTNVLAFDFGVPANGYEQDTLRVLEIQNIGSATSEHFDRLALYTDGGNGLYDGGSGDDVYVGDLYENLAQPSGKYFKIDNLEVALNSTCGSHTRFFVAADIALDYAAAGIIQFSVPKYGIDVASGNDGPTNTAVEDPSASIIPKPDQLTIFPYSVDDKVVRPASERNLNYGVGFYNGYSHSILLKEIKLFQVGSASGVEIDSLHAYADTDSNGLFDPAIDTQLAGVRSSGASYVFDGLDKALAAKRITYVFVSYDLPLTLTDSVTIDLTMFDPQSVVVELAATEIEGEFPINSPGVDVTDGMIAAQISQTPVPSYRAAPNDTNVLALAITAPTNGIWPDVLNYLAVENIGSAVAGNDIALLRVWKESGGHPSKFHPLDETPLGVMTWNGAAWTNPAALNEPIPDGGLRLYVTFDVAGSPTDATTFQAQLPVGGVGVQSGNDGPIDQFLTNPTAQTISTDPLISQLITDEPFYTVGEVITLSMTGRNEGADTLYNVIPSLLTVNGTGGVAESSGPAPASVDLAPGGSTTFVWTYDALAAGDAEFCGYALTADSLDSSQGTCSDAINIQNRASDIPVYLVNSAPASANRGQKSVRLFEITTTYATVDPLAAPLRLDGIVLNLEDGSGTPIAPNSVLDQIVITSPSGPSYSFAVSDSAANPVHLYPATAPTIQPGEQLTLEISADIADAATFTAVRASIAGLSDYVLVDANDDGPVSTTSTETFPWSTTAITINSAAESLLVSTSGGATTSANTGQDDVQLFTIDLQNPGGPNTAGELLTELQLAFFDTLGIVLSPDEVLRSITISSGAQTLYRGDVLAASGNLISAIFGTPLVISSGTNETVEVRVDLKSIPGADGFYAQAGCLGLSVRLGPDCISGPGIRSPG
jgi:hypothetical protein